MSVDATEPRWAIGLMSGTSMDGVDAALICGNGEIVAETGAWVTQPYDSGFRSRLRAIQGGTGEVTAVEKELTLRHAEAVRMLLAEAGMPASLVAVIGFHGHTILHQPERRRTWQIGDAALLAEVTGIDVVANFRAADVERGGQGAPLAPIYHAALARELERPLAVLNIGGVANVTWLGEAEKEILAFDTGPGNALIDDWMHSRRGANCDLNGALAAGGKVDPDALDALLSHPFFAAPPPKSLDRGAFDLGLVQHLTDPDGAATLTAFACAAVARAERHFPSPVKRWLICGGGRHNRSLMSRLSGLLGVAVEPVEAVGWQGDALEAQAFAHLALRSLRGLPLSLPGTTGVPRPQTGGVLARASRAPDLAPGGTASS